MILTLPSLAKDGKIIRRREKDSSRCEKHKQWMLFKAFTTKVRNRLYKEIDYNKLAMKNTTSIPGFRKGDLVQEYIHRYDQAS